VIDLDCFALEPCWYLVAENATASYWHKLPEHLLQSQLLWRLFFLLGILLTVRIILVFTVNPS